MSETPAGTPLPDPGVLAAARAEFSPEPGWAFLDTATFGLPPRATTARIAEALDGWRLGSIDWYAHDVAAESARVDFASLLGVDAGEVALLPSISIGVGVVAAGLRPDTEVLLPDDEYSSVILPMLVAESRGVGVRQVPFDRLAEEIRAGTDLVAVSSVQMHTGRAPDLAAICGRARAVGARVLLDASQGVPFHDLGGLVRSVDYLVCAGYKHLLSPRGTAFLYIRGDRWVEVPPLAANWRAVDAERGGSFLGGPLRLLPTAARFDTSLALLSWIGATESLALLRRWRDAGLFGEVARLAGRLASGLGRPTPPSSLVCVPVRDEAAVTKALIGARVRAAIRLGSVRLAPHVWTTDDDVDRAIEALLPHVAE